MQLHEALQRAEVSALLEPRPTSPNSKKPTRAHEGLSLRRNAWGMASWRAFVWGPVSRGDVNLGSAWGAEEGPRLAAPKSPEKQRIHSLTFL